MLKISHRYHLRTPKRLGWQYANLSYRHDTRLRHRCRSVRDPLEGEIWKSWNGGEDEWDSDVFAEDELVDILFEVRLTTLQHCTTSSIKGHFTCELVQVQRNHWWS